MKVELDGTEVHAATGGVELTGTEPTVLLIHGAGMDATVWQLQTRYLAHHGYRPLAVDLPGHGLTPGPALATIEELADWTATFIEAVADRLDEATPIHVVGHSMGTFIALELAARRGELVRSLVLLGTADAMPVHPELLSAAESDLPAAAALMTSWSHDRPAHVGLNPTPGLWMLGGARALVEGSEPGALAADFGACAAYEGATTAAAKVTCPVSVAVGLGDKMTPPRAAAKLIAELTEPDVVELAGTGHMMMVENPRTIRALLINALA
ncbi:MAG: alpha/beta hydrolase [Acidimicrobiia bacterium]|nr:alpha/beta hydrolase [Acidimicrobiia bacterium]